MAQYPQIKLELLSNSAQGEAIRLYIGSYSIIMRATTSNPPGFGWYLIGATVQDTAINLYNALVATYGAPFSFFPNYSVPEVGVTCNLYDVGNFTYDFDNPAKITATIIPVEAPADFNITGLSYSAASVDICNNVKVTAAIENGTAPYTARAYYFGSLRETKVVSDPNDLFFDFPRSSSSSVRMEIDSDAITASIEVPPTQRFEIITAQINYSAVDATITINTFTSQGLSIAPFQFSLDDINYQSSNVFQIGISGDYTAYAVDKYGCKRSTQFTVNLEERKPDPFFKIEITNPLRFVDQSYSGIKNIINQLSADYDISNVESRFYRQPFRIGDIIRTQLKSNYETHAVKIYDCDDTLVDTLTPILKIENINQLDKRDALIKTGEPGKANIAFIQGAVYDPITSAIIDSYFISGGRLPSFARVGMLLTFNDPLLAGSFEVEDIIYDSDLQAWVCVIDVNFSGVASSIVALSTYNLEEYNIYEVEMAMDPGQYYAVFEGTDASTLYRDQEWKTEPFWVSDDSEVVIIDYSSDINEALIDYRTNIEFRLCIPARFVKYQPDAQGEEFRDDLGNIYLQKSTYNRTWTVETDLLPWWLAEKVMIASRHRVLKVNGISVVNTEAPEITDRLGERNPFYQVTGIYQENIDISISDETGIISGARGILSGNENQVIGI